MGSETTTAEVAGVVAEAAREFPDSVVTVSHVYTFGGQQIAASYSNAVRGALTANQRLTIAGNATTETFSVIMSAIPDGASEPAPIPIKEGDRVTLRKDDNDAGTVYAVLTRQADSLKATQTIILGPKYG